ncbi:MAG: 2-C-methyl-D-erythritol 2,4-cyclodiphosphate synthase [Candidatus Portiera sp.]|nr:2-C-methyl-D-erythritol 2,4-cyclodiphosphate synthase [Portiera sp.]
MNNSSNLPLDLPGNLSIGHGYDLHALIDGDGFMLGGVTIPCDKKVVAHSDGDVLLHAICDALLGAAGLGDLGEHFPDTDDKWLNISGEKLVTLTLQKIKQCNYKVANLDSTVILESPKLSPYKLQMRDNIAALLEVSKSSINVKATCNEGMDAIGSNLAIAAHCVCLLSSTS